MAEKTRVIAARLVRFEFLSKGSEALSAHTRHVLSSVVHWPRYAYQTRVTAREVEMDGARREYAGADWIDAILFKESVQLPSAVTFKLSVSLSRDVVSKIVAATVRAGLGALGDAAQAAAPNALLGKVATAPFDALATLAGNAADPDELGRASLLFDELLLSSGGERELEFIAAEEVVARPVSAPAASGSVAATRRRKVVVRKGAVVARAVVAFDALG